MRTVLSVCALVASVAASSSAAELKPNLLLIYSDDHGWADLGANGVDADVRTPHLDQLARDGVRFTRGYVTAPQCVPSRAGVLTGRYQQRFGVEDNNKGPLPLSERTIAERLQPAGYITGQVGKWHLDIGGDKRDNRTVRQLRDHMPHAQGFAEYFRGERGAYHASHDLMGHPLADAPQLVNDSRFRVDVQTEAALAFLDRRAAAPEQPWFLYLAWFAPHVPLESPEPWFSQTPVPLPKERRQALAMIAAMDDGLGRIRAKLKAMHADERTLIVFVGDNGAPLKDGAWNGSLNRPLIGEKGMLTDGGVRVPFVAAWPGTIPAGEVYEPPVSSLDVAATAVALAGQPADGLDGVNLLPFVTGQRSDLPHETLYWRWRSQAAVLEYPWKLILLGNHKRYLFDVTDPAGELRNRIEDRPDIAERLSQKFAAWSTGLTPSGPPEPNNDQDNLFFAAHVDKTIEQVTKRRTNDSSPPMNDGNVQGWIARNATLAVKAEGLVFTPASDRANARPFLTHAGLDIVGPITATLRLRAARTSSLTFTWRTRAEKDFVAENSVRVDAPATTEWQTVTAVLPVNGRLAHLRITPGPETRGLEIQSIELRGAKGAPQIWRFGDAK